MGNLKNNEKYWAIKLNKNNRVSIITAAGIIKGTVCNVDDLDPRDEMSPKYQCLLEKMRKVNKKIKDNEPMLSIDTTPILLSDVEINNKEIKYMLIFPDKIIGISIDD